MRIEAAGGHVVWLKGPGPVRLRAAHWPDGPRGVVLLLHGRTEFIEKYLETIADLQARGFAVWTMDWRGQGASSRHTSVPYAHHIERFDDYLSDLARFIDAHVQPSLQGRKLVLMGHSMGGHLAARMLAKEPHRFERAILSAPMIDFVRGRTPGWAVRLVVAAACTSRALSERFGPGPPREPDFDRPFEGNRLTSCPDRYAAGNAMLRETPELALGGVTWGWLRAAMASIAVLRQPATIARIDMHVLVAIAGDDRVVDNRAIRRFALELRRGKIVVIEGARHDLPREHDRFRKPLWEAIDQFLAPLA